MPCRTVRPRQGVTFRLIVITAALGFLRCGAPEPPASAGTVSRPEIGPGPAAPDLEPRYDFDALRPSQVRLAVLAHYSGRSDEALHYLALSEAMDVSIPEALYHLVETGQPARARIRTAPGPGSEPIIFGPPLAVDSGGASQAAEASVALSDSMELVAAWIDLREPGGVDAWSLGVGISLDGGLTWSDSLLGPPGAPSTSFEGDPMTLYDPRTGNLWVGGTTFTHPDNLFIARKPPGATELEPVVLIGEGPFFDRGVLAAGPMPGSPDSTRLYVAHYEGIQWSDDLGATWSPIQALSSGLAQHPRVGPAGELYVSYWDMADGIELVRSFDGGATISPPLRIATRMDVWDTQDGSRFPGRFRGAPLPVLAVDPNDGTLYCVYFDTTEMIGADANVDLYFTRSIDQGDTWTVPVVINGDSPVPGDQFFPWLEVDPKGRLHLLFFDSRHTAQADDVVDGRIDVYYSLSQDAGDSWIELRLTPQPFDSAAASWPGFEQFLGDYIGLSISGDRVVAVYPATFDGDLDIYAQSIQVVSIFSDGFESGDTAAWN